MRHFPLFSLSRVPHLPHLPRMAVFAASALIMLHAQAQVQAPSPAASTCMEVKLFNLVQGKGTARLVAWGSADTFFKKPVWAQQVKVDGAVLSVPVCGLEAPMVAVTVYQDVNDNGKMDSNPLGIPTEPYGASGTPPLFSAPTWDTTKVAWEAGQTIEIHL